MEELQTDTILSRFLLGDALLLHFGASGGYGKLHSRRVLPGFYVGRKPFPALKQAMPYASRLGVGVLSF